MRKPSKRQKFIHLVDAGTFRRHQRRQAAGGHDFGPDAVFFLNPLHDAVHQPHIAVKNSGLDRVDGISPDHFFGFDDLDARQFRRALKQRFQRNRQPGAMAPPMYSPFLEIKSMVVAVPKSTMMQAS